MRKFAFSLLFAALLAASAFFTIGCAETDDHIHSFTQEVAEADYLASEATCTEKAQYYYSCTCGEKGTATFGYGDLADHPFGSEWTADETSHRHVSLCVHAVVRDEEKHSFDDNGICTVCNYNVGSLSGVQFISPHFTVDGDRLRLTTPNAQTTLSFDEEIFVADGASLDVYKDDACTEKTENPVGLTEGNNIFYIRITNGNENRVCTATIRRRPLYTVSFDTAGGTQIPSRQVEEGFCTERPSDPEKQGYTFVGFGFDFSSPITEDTVIVSRWEAIEYSITYVNTHGIENPNPTTYTAEHVVVFTDLTTDYCETVWDIRNTAGCYRDLTVTASWNCTVLQIENGIVKRRKESENIAPPQMIDLDEISRFTGIRIEGIATLAFGNDNVITGIVIPDSLVFIDNAAFVNCGNLQSISVSQGNAAYRSVNDCLIDTRSGALILGCVNSTIPDDGSVTAIGSYAFSGCSGLTEITIPDSVTTIGNAAFSGCSGLTTVTIPKNVTSVADSLFYGCSKLTEITIPDGITSIGNYAFCYCLGLTEIDIPDSVTSIGERAFQFCKGLTTVTIPQSVTSVSAGLFAGCNELTSVTIPDGVTSVGDFAFAICDKLSAITIPDSVISVGQNAFSYCTGLTSVTIGKGVTSIGKLAFRNCSGLTSITIPEKVTVIGDAAFVFCTGLTSITLPDSVTSVGQFAFCYCTGLTSITIGKGVTSIGSYVFRGCTGLTSISLPAGLTSVGRQIFAECSELKDIYYDGTVAQWQALTEKSGWSSRISPECVLHCNDGDIKAKEN